MNKWIERWKSKTPEDFKKLRNSAAYVGGTLVAVIGADKLLPIEYPELLTTILSYMVVVCIAIAGTSQFTKQS